jgi:hypothetical protein
LLRELPTEEVKMHVSLRREVVVLIGVCAALGCESGRDPRAGSPVADAGSARHAASPHLRALTGVSHLPVPVDFQALNAAVSRHYPAELAAHRVAGDVLVDVTVDEHGQVQNVSVATPRPSSQGNVHRAVIVEHVPGTNSTIERELTPRYDPRFGPAAVAALRETPFLPALRDGRAVPYTLRMTLHFDPPA